MNFAALQRAAVHRRQFTSSLIALACAATVPGLAQIVTPLGDLQPTLVLSVEHDSNVEGESGGTSSMIYTVSPSMEFLRKAGVVLLEATVGLAWERYSKVERLNGNNPFAELGATYPGGLYRCGLNLSASEAATQDTLRGGRFRQRTYQGSVRLDRKFTGPWGAALFGSWKTTEDLQDAQAAQDTWRIGPRVTYQVNELIALYGGYTARSTDTRSNAARRKQGRQSSGFELGIDGDLPVQISPRVRLSANAGYEVREGQGGEATGGVIGNASFDYALTSRTVLSASLSQDIVTSLDEENARRTSLTLGVRHSFLPRLRGSALIGTSRVLFDGSATSENQDTYLAALRLDYDLVQYASVETSLRGETASSDEATRAYDRLVARLAVTLRY